MHNILTSGIADATPEEVAAALAAVSLVLAEAAQGTAAPAPQSVGWHDAARLTTQGLAPWRTPTTARWATIERIRRAGRGGAGITGI